MSTRLIENADDPLLVQNPKRIARAAVDSNHNIGPLTGNLPDSPRKTVGDTRQNPAVSQSSKRSDPIEQDKKKLRGGVYRYDTRSVQFGTMAVVELLIYFLTIVSRKKLHPIERPMFRAVIQLCDMCFKKARALDSYRKEMRMLGLRMKDDHPWFSRHYML